MAGRKIPEAQRHVQAIQAARRMISRGELPGYRLTPAQDGTWAIVGLPGVIVTAENRREALSAARAAIASVLEVDPATFDLG